MALIKRAFIRLSRTFAASLVTGGVALGATPYSASLASGCSGCHGLSGSGYGSLPPISGLSPAEFSQAMLEFKTEHRKGTVMNRIAQGFTQDELMELAHYFAEFR